jgi:hypothetical protein
MNECPYRDCRCKPLCHICGWGRHAGIHVDAGWKGITRIKFHVFSLLPVDEMLSIEDSKIDGEG